MKGASTDVEVESGSDNKSHMDSSAHEDELESIGSEMEDDYTKIGETNVSQESQSNLPEYVIEDVTRKHTPHLGVLSEKNRKRRKTSIVIQILMMIYSWI